MRQPARPHSFPFRSLAAARDKASLETEEGTEKARKPRVGRLKGYSAGWSCFVLVAWPRGSRRDDWQLVCVQGLGVKDVVTRACETCGRATALM